MISKSSISPVQRCRTNQTPSKPVLEKHRSKLFVKCVKEDVPPLGDTSVKDLSRTKLLTYAFICALLKGKEGFVTATRRSAAQAAYEAKTKPCVFFLHEFPSLNKERDSMKQLRFMWNVFRAVNVFVVQRSTTDTLADIESTVKYFRDGENDPKVCFVLLASLSRFHTPYDFAHLNLTP